MSDEIVRIVVAALIGGLATNFLNQRTFGVALAKLSGEMLNVENRIEALEKQYVLVPRRRSDDKLE